MYMIILVQLITIFFVFSIIGWYYEYIVFNKHEGDKVSKKLFNINLPMLPIYGVGAIILFLIHKNLKNYSIWFKTLIAFILINTMECLLGYVSYTFHGYQTWNYNSDDNISYCDGYISVQTSIWWTVLSFITFLILDKINFN